MCGVGEPAIVHAHTKPAHFQLRYHIFLTGNARMTVVQSLLGAMQRLSRRSCQQLFEDFTDQAGRALTVKVAATSQSPAALLAGLYFVNGDNTSLCRTGQAVAAFTAPGSQVIHICSQRFLDFAVKTKGGEIVLIHELLHSLGLGENPPTSSGITDAVLKRCS
jgi:hypothetical protein